MGGLTRRQQRSGHALLHCSLFLSSAPAAPPPQHGPSMGCPVDSPAQLTQQVHGQVVLKKGDVGVGGGSGHQGALNLGAGGVCSRQERRGAQRQHSRKT